MGIAHIEEASRRIPMFRPVLDVLLSVFLRRCKVLYLIVAIIASMLMLYEQTA